MILNSPYISGSITVTGNSIVSGSITVLGGLSGSSAVSASYAVSASNAATASSADNLLVRNTLTAQTIVVQTITSSVDFVTGSTRFGQLSSNTHVFTGSMSVTGGLVVNAGNVGIGTSSPTALLHVSGTTGGVFEVDGAAAVTALYVSASGNVGIGTTIPSQKFEIVSGSLAVTAGNISINTSQSIFFAGPTDGNWRMYRFPTASFTKSLATGNTLNINAHYGTGEGFAIGANGGSSYYEISGSAGTTPTHFFRGNVGIGNTSPTARLHVGSGSQTAINIADTKIHIANSGSSGRAALLTLATDPSGSSVEGQIESSGEVFPARIIMGSATNHDLIFRTNNIERMRISSGSALVNIGSSTAAAFGFISSSNLATSMGITFHNGSTYSKVGGVISVQESAGSHGLELWVRSGGTEAYAVRVGSGGNVGIGTNNPQERLDIAGLNGNIRVYGRSGIGENQIASNVFYNGSIWTRDNASYGAASIILNSTNGQLTFHTTASTSGYPTERMRISSGGNIGVGNTNPQATLHLGPSLNTMPSATSIAVAGDTSIRFTGGADGNSDYGSYIAGTQYGGVRSLSLGYRQGAGDILTMTITQLSTNTGSVGIGTTNPTRRLTVSKTTETTAGGIELRIVGGVSDGNNDGIFFTQGSAGATPMGSIRCEYKTSGFPDIAIYTRSGSSTESAKMTIANNGLTTVALASGVNDRIIRIGRSAGAYYWSIGIDSANSLFNFYNNSDTSVANISPITGNYTATSDQRAKKDIEDSNTALDKIDLIKVRKFKWKDTDAQEDYGLIAQELVEVLPTSVMQGNENTNWGICRDNVVPFLIKAIQELKAEIDILKNK